MGTSTFAGAKAPMSPSGRCCRARAGRSRPELGQKKAEEPLLTAERGDLEALMRNKPMQSRYDEWMVGMKVQYGSTGELGVWA